MRAFIGRVAGFGPPFGVFSISPRENFFYLIEEGFQGPSILLAAGLEVSLHAFHKILQHFSVHFLKFTLD